MKTSSIFDLRWLLVACVVFFCVGNVPVHAADALGKAGDAKTELSYKNSYDTAKDADGMNVMFLGFAVGMTVCLLIGLGLAVVCVLTFMRTHEWSKIQNMFFGMLFLFGLGGMFFWLMEKSDETTSVIK